MKRYLPLVLCVILIGAGCSRGQSLPNANPPAQQKTVNGGTELDLSGRALTAIPSYVFSRTDLVKLDLSNNELTGAPQSQLGQLKSLTSLNLSGNALTGLPAELGQLNRLEVLDVSKNKLTGLPMELGNLTQLRIFNISDNPYSAQDLDEIASTLSNTEILR